MSKANAEIKDPTKEAIGVTLWTLASRAIVYNKKYSSEVYLLDKRHDQFDIWQKDSPLGKDMIVIDISFAHKDIASYMKCDSVRELTTFNLIGKSKENKNIALIKCTNYQGIR